MRKTKIICTIGPASESQDKLEHMMQLGMNVARLNFSHGNHEEHRQRIETIRAAAAAQGQNIAIMLDTRGPEIRTGLLCDKKVYLESDKIIMLTTREVIGDDKQVSINYPNLPAEVKVGDSILISDGLLHLIVENTNVTDIFCRVINGGELGERKGINVPGIRLQLPFLSDQDIEDIKFGIELDVDFIAASFVRSPDDMVEIRRLLEYNNAKIDIIAKIESQSGVDNLDAIIQLADGVMVARGDLGVEIPAEEVPLVQRSIIEKCNSAGKIVIIATQMLDSMINNPRPTRAEISDVANAIFDGADAIMLSGESAAGKYPLESVETMARVALRIEKALPYREMLDKKRIEGTLTVTDAISYATCSTAMNLGINTIITATSSGGTARMVAKYRPQADIVVVTPYSHICRKLALVWGVYPIVNKFHVGAESLWDDSLQACLSVGYIKEGDVVVMTGGDPPGFSGGTNLLKVHTVGNILLKGTGIGKKAVSGKVIIINNHQDLSKIKSGDILVCRGVCSDMVPILKDISAIIAEDGGMTSDAAIMGLSSDIPVVVGVTDATKILKDDMIITLDPIHGRIYKGLVRVM